MKRKVTTDYFDGYLIKIILDNNSVSFDRIINNKISFFEMFFHTTKCGSPHSVANQLSSHTGSEKHLTEQKKSPCPFTCVQWVTRLPTVDGSEIRLNQLRCEISHEFTAIFYIQTAINSTTYVTLSASPNEVGVDMHRKLQSLGKSLEKTHIPPTRE